MMRNISAVILAVLLSAGGARAQVWDSPSFMGPDPGSDIGVYVLDGDFSDLGIQGIWRQDAPDFRLGLRVGYLDTPDGVLLVGGETWGDIVLEGASFPLDLAWTAGVGAFFNGGTGISVPLGISIGHTFGGSVPIQLYGHPRLGLRFHSVNDNLNADLEGQFDIGADFSLGDSWKLRVGASLGDFEALGFGIAWH